MADVIVRARAPRWVSDDFPGWIEVSLVDAYGQDHRIVEKVSVLTAGDLGPASSFPLELWIRADAGDVDAGRVRTDFAAAVETTEGLPGFDASVDDVVWL